MLNLIVLETLLLFLFKIQHDLHAGILRVKVGFSKVDFNGRVYWFIVDLFPIYVLAEGMLLDFYNTSDWADPLHGILDEKSAYDVLGVTG